MASSSSPSPAELLAQRHQQSQKDGESADQAQSHRDPITITHSQTSSSAPPDDDDPFPALGSSSSPAVSTPPTWGSGKTPVLTAAAAAAAATTTTTTTSSSSSPAPLTLPSQHVERIRFAPSQLLPSTSLKKPYKEILKDVGRRNKAILEMKSGLGGDVVFEARSWASTSTSTKTTSSTATAPGGATTTAPPNVRRALMEVASEVGSKQSVTIPIPASARPYLIGRAGATIHAVHDRTGAKIHIPRPDPSLAATDATIPIQITGDAVTAELARREITALLDLHDKSTTATVKVTDVPAELYPFLRGVDRQWVDALESRFDGRVSVEIPVYTTWDRVKPPAEPTEPSAPGSWTPDPSRPIVVSGERSKVLPCKTEIQQRAKELAGSVTIRTVALNRGQHQFVLDDAAPDAAAAVDGFLAETGCTVLLPPEHAADADAESLSVLGPVEKIDAGVTKAIDAATAMRMSSVDVSRMYPVPHALALTAYARARGIVSKLEKAHDARIVLPATEPTGVNTPTAVVWEVYSRDGKNAVAARGEVMGVLKAYPESRVVRVGLDHAFFGVATAVKEVVAERYGVYMLVPRGGTGGQVLPVQDVVLVAEGKGGDVLDGKYRVAPSAADLEAYTADLQDAKAYLLSRVGDTNDVKADAIDVPLKYHDKLRKYIAAEQAAASESSESESKEVYVPVKLSSINTTVHLRGHTAPVTSLRQKIEAWVETQQQEDRERGYTVTFEFPAKHLPQLIGRRGESVNKLRDEFDVEIKVLDNTTGKVEVKGPKAKADAAKARIVALGKKLEDEASYVLKVPAKFHRDLIGAKGSQVMRLQDRYHVRIQFPRAAPATPVEGDEDVSEAGAGAKQRNTQAPDEIVVRGPKRGADAARDEILSLYQYLQDNSYTATVSVQRPQVPSLIGPGGREMDRVRAETGAQIDVPGPYEPADEQGRVEIKIKGTKKAVEAARQVLEGKRKEFDETVTRVVQVDRKRHLKALIGVGGANVRKIVAEAVGGPVPAEQAARMVRFPREHEREGETKEGEPDLVDVRVEGKPAVVDKIITAIEEFVKVRDDQVTATIDVPPSQHRKLIGRNGDARRALESDTGCVIDVPRQGSGKTGVRLRGSSKAVAAATERIQALVVPEVSDTVSVELGTHRALLAETGPEGARALYRKFRDWDVSVDHRGGQAQVPTPAVAGESVVVDRVRATTNAGAMPLITDEPGNAPAYSWTVVEAKEEQQAGDKDGEITTEIPWVLTGSQSNVAKAKTALEKAVAAAARHAQDATAYLILPDPSTYRFVVGPGGSKINEIRRKHGGVRIQVPRGERGANGDGREAIEIKGPREGLEGVRDAILEAVEQGVARGGRR